MLLICACLRCGCQQPQKYGNVLCCIDCYIDIKRHLVLDRIDFGAALAPSFQTDLALFLAPHLKLQRLHFLRCALLSQGSVFRNLTFFFYGNAGNISWTEDVLDRVISFL